MKKLCKSAGVCAKKFFRTIFDIYLPGRSVKWKRKSQDLQTSLGTAVLILLTSLSFQREKNTADNQENTGYAKPGTESLYNTYIMEELQTILAVGAGASTKLVDRRTGRIKRITNHKYPYEYLDRFNDILENKREIFSFFV